MLLRENCPVLAALTRELPYEIAVGVNGRIWLKAHSLKETVALANAISALEQSGCAEIDKICGNLGDFLQA